MDTPRQTYDMAYHKRLVEREARRAFDAFLRIPSAHNYVEMQLAMQFVQEARNERNALLEAQRAE